MGIWYTSILSFASCSAPYSNRTLPSSKVSSRQTRLALFTVDGHSRILTITHLGTARDSTVTVYATRIARRLSPGPPESFPTVDSLRDLFMSGHFEMDSAAQALSRALRIGAPLNWRRIRIWLSQQSALTRSILTTQTGLRRLHFGRPGPHVCLVQSRIQRTPNMPQFPQLHLNLRIRLTFQLCGLKSLSKIRSCLCSLIINCMEMGSIELKGNEIILGNPMQ
jgi:hypothetical protein